ncbi:MAG: amidohydrolase family protein [Rhodospirillales bacterium]|nr:amidohydrolase family protein [Rhodospirillales bacterium]
MKTIDADAHVIESDRTWSYLADGEQHFAPMVLDRVAGEVQPRRGPKPASRYWYSGDFIQSKDNADTVSMDADSREMGNVKTRLAHMDELNIDVQVLYPTIFLAPCARDAAQEAAQYRAYNRWLADIWKIAGDRLRWAACAPLYSMHKVRDELKFAKDHGACCVFVRPFECDRYVGESYFDPLFSAAEELDLAIAFHSGNASYQLNGFHGAHNFGRFKLAVIAQFHWLLEYEVPKKYPNLRWAFIEASASWIPYALGDVESRLKRKGKKLSDNPLADNNIWVTAELTDDIPYIIDRVGNDNLIVGTDYGHTDTAAEIEALRLLKERDGISAASVDKILGPNPTKLYAL